MFVYSQHLYPKPQYVAGCAKALISKFEKKGTRFPTFYGLKVLFLGHFKCCRNNTLKIRKNFLFPTVYAPFMSVWRATHICPIIILGELKKKKWFLKNLTYFRFCLFNENTLFISVILFCYCKKWQ